MQFKDAAQAAGLLDAFSSPGFNGTVFAPNDMVSTGSGLVRMMYM